MQKAPLISVVEDDQFFRESIRRLLRSQGYSIEAFASAVDFLASPRLKETAVLIADVNMPAMSGIELCGNETTPKSTVVKRGFRFHRIIRRLK